MHKGAQPSCGGSRRKRRDNGFGWRAACRGVGGEPARPGLPPEGETEKGEINLLAAAGRELGFLFGRGCNGLGAPAAWAALEHVSVVEHAIEHRTDGGHVAQEFPPVFHRPVGSK